MQRSETMDRKTKRRNATPVLIKLRTVDYQNLNSVMDELEDLRTQYPEFCFQVEIEHFA